jgi:trypsin
MRVMYKEIILQFVILAVSQAQISPKIIGGVNVTSIEGFEHQVSIRDAAHESSRFGSGHLCGGSIIGYDKVLTAAHCVHSGIKFLPPRYFVVVMGNLDLQGRSLNTLVRKVKKVIGHKQFDADTFENDIAVLILNEPIPKDHPTAKPIPIPKSLAHAGQSCTSSGWG